MRWDMSKVITEGYRRERPVAAAIKGARRKFRNRIDPDGESGPTRIGMRKDIFSRTHRKLCMSRLGPFERFVLSQVNRPWNLVHHEICAKLDLRSTVQWHVRFHLEMLVEIDTAVHDGVVVSTSSGVSRPVHQSSFLAYVDPFSGILLPVV